MPDVDQTGERARSPFETFSAAPRDTGLYHPDQEKDACGLAMIATLSGEGSHEIVDQALIALRALEHRGAVGADEGTGDGAGILLQIPDAFFRAEADFALPRWGSTRWAPPTCPPTASAPKSTCRP